MTDLNFIGMLPDIEESRRIFQAAAILDAILMPEWEYRYYSYNAHWDENEQMASMRDGEGDHYFALFQPNGLIIKGFDQRFNRVHGPHDVLQGVPNEFEGFLKEPAFIMDETTFCTWKLQGSQAWSASKELDAKAYELLHILNGKADYYYAWATEYYEISLDRSLVQRIFDIEPLNGKMLKGLNEELEFAGLEEDIQEIDYPVKRED
ncbi:hypothetical protein [Paenibacillus brasilensis]|uniref:Uncharacterized protein n=1 Tax=Paenibacillus brasilensis TaxID=128574 RepID=A0ABU0L310_9BACL|nr:hypothetical protein [Paenibacillus brasilensis]MDQ0495685.1 hypothetical protein [Paenibacillus brasilensis]